MKKSTTAFVSSVIGRYLITHAGQAIRASIAATLTLVGTMTATHPARAELLNWSLPGRSFDNGVRPRITYGGGNSPWAVEVHQGQDGAGPLWVSLALNAIVNSESMPTFGGASSYVGYGFAPVVAALDDTHFIEVHQGGQGVGSEWSSIGTVDINNNVVTIPGANPYDSGLAPTIAANRGLYIEVHQGGSGVAPLWYHMGSLSGGWQANGAEIIVGSQVISGVNPSVALVSDEVNGNLAAVLVYQQAQGPSALMYMIGELLNPSTVVWSTPAQYDTGFAPSIASVESFDTNNGGTTSASRIVEVHQASASASALWYRTAFIEATGDLDWDSTSYQYDWGYLPSIAWSPYRNQGTDVHQGASTSAPLWEHEFITQAAVPYLQQIPSNWCWLAAGEMAMLASWGTGFTDTYPGAYECAAANLRQHTAINNNEQVKGWNNGQFIDCCVNISSQTCNHTGSVQSVLHDRSCNFDTTSGAAPWSTLVTDVEAGRAAPFFIDGPSTHWMVVAGEEVDRAGQDWVLVYDPASEPFAQTYSDWSAGSLPGYTLETTLTNIHSCQ